MAELDRVMGGELYRPLTPSGDPGIGNPLCY